jgi:hypothetical protein
MEYLGAYMKQEARDQASRVAMFIADLQRVFKCTTRKIEALNKDQFLQFCCKVLGDTEPVVVKFMMYKVFAKYFCTDKVIFSVVSISNSILKYCFILLTVAS